MYGEPSARGFGSDREMCHVTLTRGYAPGVRMLAVVVAITICIVAYVTSEVFLSPTDAYVYLAAGERLNAGHDLYAIGPGDRFIGLNPPYWTVPTLSPPLLGVLWQPLALIGVPGMLLGWALAGVAYLVAVAAVVWRSPIVGVVLTALLAPFIGWQVGLGNVNGFLVLGVLGVWLVRDRPWVVGLILALMVSVKVVPIVLVMWLLTTGRRRALAATASAGALLLVVSVLAAGVDAHLDYLGVVLHTASTGNSVTSVAGLLLAAGLPNEIARLAPWAILIIGSIVMWMFRAREHVTFSVAVFVMLLAAPALQPYWLAMLIVALAPLARDEVTRPIQFPRAVPVA